MSTFFTWICLLIALTYLMKAAGKVDYIIADKEESDLQKEIREIETMKKMKRALAQVDALSKEKKEAAEWLVLDTSEGPCSWHPVHGARD